MTAPTPTGKQVLLRRDGVSAQIAQVGASLRALTVEGVDIIAPYPADAPAPACSGVVLVPWPNRIRDGRWHDGDEVRQLSLSEPALSNASHGLLRFTAYAVTQHAPDTATLDALVVPQTGYPYLLETSVTYALTADGIDVSHTITNRSGSPAPVAVGTHPFVTIGGAEPHDLVLRIPAETSIETDDRMLPVGDHPVHGNLDLRAGRRLGDLALDTAFTQLRRDPDGMARSTLTAPDGRQVTLWQGTDFDYVQAYTTTAYPGQSLALAIEPMTAPADAFNSGTGLRRLLPGESWSPEWGLSLSLPAR